MRGARRVVRGRGRRVGIIPAYAGSTGLLGSGREVRWDHPRVCGEHPCVSTALDFRAGSSPRMRGARTARRANLHDPGIIPAYAGSTIYDGSKILVLEDHPRVCGEHVKLDPELGDKRGSSPRMRGAHYSFELCSQARRIIPAYAGSTMAHNGSGIAREDHPRVCGEHRPQCIAKSSR